jgi:hypothetical protein
VSKLLDPSAIRLPARGFAARFAEKLRFSVKLPLKIHGGYASLHSLLVRVPRPISLGFSPSIQLIFCAKGAKNRKGEAEASPLSKIFFFVSKVSWEIPFTGAQQVL